MDYLEEALDLNRFVPYVQASSMLKQAGFFVSPPKVDPAVIRAGQMVVDIQSNLARLGYRVAVTGQMDDDTRRAVRMYAKKHRIKFADLQAVIASLCKDLKGECANASQMN